MWVADLASVLELPYGPTVDFGLKTQVFSALCHMMNNFGREFTPFLGHVLPAVWAVLVGNRAMYIATVVNQVDAVEESVDEDGIVLSFENEVFAMMEVVLASVERKQVRRLLADRAVELADLLVGYMQITQDQCDEWIGDAHASIEYEDEEMMRYSYTVRASCMDVVQEMCRGFGAAGVAAVLQAVQTHMTAASTALGAGNAAWWKLAEAAFVALTLVIDTADEIGMAEVRERRARVSVTLASLATAPTSKEAHAPCDMASLLPWTRSP